jgi:hypothetical protein
MGLFQRKKHSENATQIPDESMDGVVCRLYDRSLRIDNERPTQDSGKSELPEKDDRWQNCKRGDHHLRCRLGRGPPASESLVMEPDDLTTRLAIPFRKCETAVRVFELVSIRKEESVYWIHLRNCTKFSGQ